MSHLDHWSIGTPTRTIAIVSPMPISVCTRVFYILMKRVKKNDEWSCMCPMSSAKYWTNISFFSKLNNHLLILVLLVWPILRKREKWIIKSSRKPKNNTADHFEWHSWMNYNWFFSFPSWWWGWLWLWWWYFSVWRSRGGQERERENEINCSICMDPHSLLIWLDNMSDYFIVENGSPSSHLNDSYFAGYIVCLCNRYTPRKRKPQRIEPTTHTHTFIYWSSGWPKFLSIHTHTHTHNICEWLTNLLLNFFHLYIFVRPLRFLIFFRFSGLCMCVYVLFKLTRVVFFLLHVRSSNI